MKMTSAQAAKLLRQLNEELRTLQIKEESTRTFLAALGEDPESIRPEYDYESMQKLQNDIEKKIRKVKHSINCFNSTYIIPEYGFTIDEMLVYLPQLTKRYAKLSSMKNALPKTRENASFSRNTQIIDYRYANYDIDKVASDYTEVSEELAKAQTALDYINNTVEIDIEI
ncbi:MAG: hypothetical protein E7505_04930 [Ruminococcus sp.]|nr:hypothetical protein [Ruminococcus sp.]